MKEIKGIDYDVVLLYGVVELTVVVYQEGDKVDPDMLLEEARNIIEREGVEFAGGNTLEYLTSKVYKLHYE